MRKHFRFAVRCLPAIVLLLALCSNTMAAVLTYWAFNNASGASGSTPGSFRSGSPENYDAATKTLSIASLGDFANESTIDFSHLAGTMGTGTTNTWGTFSGYTGNAEAGFAAGQSFAVAGQNGSNYYVDFKLKSTGYQPMSLSYDVRASNSGAHEHDWQYSTNGVDWVDLPSITWASGTGNYVKSLDLSGISAISNQNDLYFRMQFIGGQSTGTCRIDNWKILGEAIGTPTLTWNPSAGGNSWDSSTSNWLNGSSSVAFASGDVVVFTDAGLADGSTINVTANTLNPGEIRVQNTTGVYTFTGNSLSGSGNLTKTGAGAIAFGVSNTEFSGTISINEGALLANNNLPTTTNVVLNGGSIRRDAGAGDVVFSQPSSRIIINNPTQFDTNGGNLEVAGELSGFGYDAIGVIKTGEGTLTLSCPNEHQSYYNHIVQVQQGTLRLNAENTAQYTAIGQARLQVKNGGTFHLDGTDLSTLGGNDGMYYWVRDYFYQGFGDYTRLETGGTILGTGKVVLKNGNLQVHATDAGVPNYVDLKTNSSTDAIYVQSAIHQWQTSLQNPIYATIRVGGAGRIVLQDGGYSSSYTFGGDWEVEGNLQIGPVVPNYDTGLNDYWGPYGEPLNALGFKTFSVGTSRVGDPDSPNAVTVKTGGTLILAVDGHNTNPNITSSPINATPDYLRNPITLKGGAIAASGYQVSYDQTSYDGQFSGDQGVPTTTLVTAKFGGDFTVEEGFVSKVFTYDPVETTGARKVHLIGGNRTVNDSPAHPGGATITYATNWKGTLEVVADPTTHVGGSFEILRDAGTVSVGENALLLIDANTTVYAGGLADAFTDSTDSSKHLRIENNGTFGVIAGAKSVGSITGTGTTVVYGSAQLTAPSITQDSLVIGGTMPTVTAVPEPNSLLLLALASIGGLFAICRCNRG
jgi:autotransporter-associated beta strand protein